MEPFNGNSSFRMPKGWATVAAHITVAGVTRPERERIRGRIKNKLAPSYHLCPVCTEDKEKIERERLAAEAEARKISQLTEPARRQIRLEE